MTEPQICCEYCAEFIVEYYHEGYKGKRGKCTKCGIDFPLD